MASILVFGDSNSHGTKPLTALGQFARFDADTRWPGVMARALGAAHAVIADGLPGRTTVHDDLIDGGARNGAAVLPAVLGSHVPLDLVVLMLGTNDLKPRFATTAFDIAKSVERLAGICRMVVPGVAVLVIAPAPVKELGVLDDAFAGAEARQAGLEAHLEAACARIDAAFLRAGDHVVVSDVDGVHWEAEAHLRFGQVVAEVVAGLLPDVAAPPKAAGFLPAPDPATPVPPVAYDRLVPRDWVDYNGHMNEAHYLSVISDATDQLLHWAGMDAACVAEGFSVFTVETHIRHLEEINIGDRVRVTTRVIEGGAKKLHVWHEMFVGDTLCATGEQLLLHMDLATRKSALPRADVAAWLGAVRSAHAGLPVPEGLGRAVGQRV